RRTRTRPLSPNPTRHRSMLRRPPAGRVRPVPAVRADGLVAPAVLPGGARTAAPGLRWAQSGRPARLGHGRRGGMTVVEFAREGARWKGPNGSIAGNVWEPTGTVVGSVLLSAPLGITMRDLFGPTYLLLCNGFRVVQFDPTNHTGAS